jgi:DNA-binding CsgD family transcriptional regulator/PAS domain-containing protein
LSELIGSIYDCALDPERWDQMLCKLRDVFNGQTAQLGLVKRRGGRFLISKDVGMGPELLEIQARHAPEINALVAGFYEKVSTDEPHVVSRHLPRKDWEIPYFQESRKRGFVDMMTYALIWDSEHFSGFGIGRLERQGLFTNREITLGGLLLPHLRRAVTISKVLDARAIEKARMAEALDALKCGVVLTDGSSAILHANSAAERMFRHGWSVQSARGMLAAKLPAAAKELRTAIKLAAQDESALGMSGLAIRLSEHDEAPVFAHVLPLTGGELRAGLEPEAVAAVFIGAAQDEAEAAQAMASAYGLTPAETRLLESLLAGHTLTETATALGIAMTTAKTHLDNIFQKTGVNRQAELIRLAARAAPPVASRLSSDTRNWPPGGMKT